jgi:hypothetical protein
VGVLISPAACHPQTPPRRRLPAPPRSRHPSPPRTHPARPAGSEGDDPWSFQLAALTHFATRDQASNNHAAFVRALGLGGKNTFDWSLDPRYPKLGCMADDYTRFGAARGGGGARGRDGLALGGLRRRRGFAGGQGAQSQVCKHSPSFPSPPHPPIFPPRRAAL